MPAIDISGSLLEKMVDYIGKRQIRQKIEKELIDPLLNHIMRRIFPYIILICVLFVLLLFVVLLTLGIIVFQLRAARSAVGVGT
jgi:hypothetical protein